MTYVLQGFIVVGIFWIVVWGTAWVYYRRWKREEEEEEGEIDAWKRSEEQ